MTAADPDWPFDDPPNVAVITIRQIIRGEHIVDYVAHDDDDGAWQFLNRAVNFKMADAMLVGLSEMVKFDSSLRELWTFRMVGVPGGKARVNRGNAR